MAELTYRFGFEMIAVSGWIKKMIGQKRVKVIANGIDLDIFNHGHRTFEGNKIVVGFNYRDIDWKGAELHKTVYDQLYLLDGFEILVLISENIKDSYFKGTRCVYAQDQNDVASFYRECDVFLHFSTIEGFGLPPLEAMACGCVVLLTDSGGVMEYSIDQYNSLLVSVDPADIINKLEHLRNNVSLRKRVSFNAVSTAKNFKIEKMLNLYVDYFN
jgi:glycosyltransferase involved in cell wall biosynthesis